MTTLLIILVTINFIFTVFYANKFENIMRMLKDSTADQIILSESRVEDKIKKTQNDIGELNEKVQSIMFKI